MTTKTQLEALVIKIMELQYNHETVHSVIFHPYHLAINTASGNIIFIDTAGKETIPTILPER